LELQSRVRARYGNAGRTFRPDRELSAALGGSCRDLQRAAKVARALALPAARDYIERSTEEERR
jgi:hypothetical protein